MFGSIMHKTMHLLYSQLDHSEITKKDLQKLIASDEIKNKAIEKAVFEEYYKSDNKNTYHHDGRILLLKEVIKKYIDGIIIHDLHSTPFTIIGLEKKFFANFKINDRGALRSIKLGGIVDRIDRKDTLVRVIDYKTGITKSTAANINALFEEQYSHMNSPVFQILLYCNILSEEFSAGDLQPALFFIRDIFNTRFNSHITVEKKYITRYTEISSIFEERLLKTIQDIFDNKVPFRQTGNMELCKYCDFNLICHR
jgi:ATP-dependent helicase/DNAse subunit B